MHGMRDGRRKGETTRVAQGFQPFRLDGARERETVQREGAAKGCSRAQHGVTRTTARLRRGRRSRGSGLDTPLAGGGECRPMGGLA